MSGVWTEQDQKYWEDKENQFIYNFNLLFTSGDYWDRNPENVKPREEALRKLYQQAIQMQAVVGVPKPNLTDNAKVRINELGLLNKEIDNMYNSIIDNDDQVNTSGFEKVQEKIKERLAIIRTGNKQG